MLRFGGNLCDCTCITLNGRSRAKQTMCFFRSTFFYAIVWFSCNKSRWSDSYTTEFKGKTFFVFDIVNVFRVNELTEICIGCYLSSTRLRLFSVRCVQAYKLANPLPKVSKLSNKIAAYSTLSYKFNWLLILGYIYAHCSMNSRVWIVYIVPLEAKLFFCTRCPICNFFRSVFTNWFIQLITLFFWLI